MGFWGRIFGRSALEVAETTSAGGVQSQYGFTVVDPGIPVGEYSRHDIDVLWRSQPNLRKVVGFIARNVASIPLHVYQREADGSRIRVRDHALARMVSRPSAVLGASRFWNGVISDMLLYDQWCVAQVVDKSGVDRLVHLPSWRLRITLDGLNQLERVEYWTGEAGREWKTLPADRIVVYYGYAPNSAGSPMALTLLDILNESSEAVKYRRQVWSQSARTPMWIERPADAPSWSVDAKRKFAEAFRNSYTGDGPHAGGSPLLEDGMKLHSLTSFSPQDSRDLEGRKLTAAEVASAFHVAPELVGAREGTFANVDAFRQMLYRDSLGPYITDWVDTLNAQLTPRVDETGGLYVEAHLEAKLAGSFLEQAEVLSRSTGAPWMTRNEARQRMNMPNLPEGSELVTPLNVITGGLASPADTGSQNRRAMSPAPGVKSTARLQFKSSPSEPHSELCVSVLRKFFERQSRVVLSRLGAKDPEWWDGERWDKELADDLYRVAVSVAREIGESVAGSLGMPGDAFDMDRVYAFLKSVAGSRAEMLNQTTLSQLQAALNGDLEEDAVKSTVQGVFDEATGSRADESGVTLATTLSTLACVEAGKQLGGGKATKTWIVTSGNPRPSHAAMDGETVPVSESFSNGMAWPGDKIADVDEIANCRCEVEISIP